MRLSFFTFIVFFLGVKLFKIYTMGIKRGVDQISTDTDITEDEAALYDRQIRLWGLESQKRLRHAKILLIGMGGLGAEIAKNIALAGVKSITLLDNKTVGTNDLTAQFFLAGAEPGKNRAEASRDSIHALNPNVDVVYEPGYADEKEDEYFAQFSIVCCTECSPDLLLKLDKICRENDVKFLCGDTWGQYGYCFVDLNHFKYMDTFPVFQENTNEEPSSKKRRASTDSILKSTDFCSLDKAMSLKYGKAGTGLDKRISKVFFLIHIMFKFREAHGRFPSADHRDEDIENLKKLRKSVVAELGFADNKITDDVLSYVFGEISPVCAIVGGVLAQEIIKAVCADQIPVRNFFLFNGEDGSGVVENVGNKICV